MSTCGCPNPFSFVSGSCINDTPAFSGVSGSSVTFTSGDTNQFFAIYGTFFYEDITNKTLPLTFNNDSVSTPPYTTVTINPGSVSRLVDGSNFTPSDVSSYYGYNDVNISGQPINIVYTATSANTLWCSSGLSDDTGRMNNSGIKVSTGLNEWVGFSYCLTVPSTQQFHLFLGADDLFRLKINDEWVIKRINSVPSNILTLDTSVVADGIVDKRSSDPPIYNLVGWVNVCTFYNHIIPITLTAGTYTFDFSFTDILTGGGNKTNGTFEIYSGVSTSTLTGFTTYSQLSGSVVFSTSQISGTTQTSPAESGDTYGVWCVTGDTLLGVCTSTPFCRAYTASTGCCPSVYCISDTDTIIDDQYFLTDYYNNESYWVGISNGHYIYYDSGNTQWCLSSTLGGSCLLSGKSPCVSNCPDLCDFYFFTGACPTTTTTTTIDCSTLDFNALFDCDISATTTTTTTAPPTTTTTTTLPPLFISAARAAVTTTTTTIPPTTTTTTTINYGVNFSGDVTFNLVDVDIKCPISKEFKDCTNSGIRYFTNDTLINPSGGTIDVDSVFLANVDGFNKCITYVGINNDQSPINNITLLDSYGLFPTGCESCLYSPICLQLYLDGNSFFTYNCTLPYDGFYNGLPYYQILDGNDCTTPVVGNFIWFNTTLNEWVYTTDGLGGTNVVYYLSESLSPTVPLGTWGSDIYVGLLTSDYVCQPLPSETTTTTTSTTTQPTCRCYQISTKNTNDFGYTDCSGVNQIITLSAQTNGVQEICSRTLPTVSGDSEYDIRTILNSCGDLCFGRSYCYTVENKGDSILNYWYYNSENELIETTIIPNTTSNNFCSRTIPQFDDSVSLVNYGISGGTQVCTSDKQCKILDEYVCGVLGNVQIVSLGQTTTTSEYKITRSFTTPISDYSLVGGKLTLNYKTVTCSPSVINNYILDIIINFDSVGNITSYSPNSIIEGDVIITGNINDFNVNITKQSTASYDCLQFTETQTIELIYNVCNEVISSNITIPFTVPCCS